MTDLLFRYLLLTVAVGQVIFRSIHDLSSHRSLLLRVVHGRRPSARERRPSRKRPPGLRSWLRTSHRPTGNAASDSRRPRLRHCDAPHASPPATDHRLLATSFFVAGMTLYYAGVNK